MLGTAAALPHFSDNGGIVGSDQKSGGAIVEGGESLELASTNDWREQQNPRDPGIHHVFGLRKGGTADTECSCGNLPARNFYRLMDLHHWAEAISPTRGVFRHRRDIRVHRIDVEYQSRCLETLTGAGDPNQCF